MTNEEINLTLSTRTNITKETAPSEVLLHIKSIYTSIQYRKNNRKSSARVFVGCPHSCKAALPCCVDCWAYAISDFKNNEGSPVL